MCLSYMFSLKQQQNNNIQCLGVRRAAKTPRGLPFRGPWGHCPGWRSDASHLWLISQVWEGVPGSSHVVLWVHLVRVSKNHTHGSSRRFGRPTALSRLVQVLGDHLGDAVEVLKVEGLGLRIREGGQSDGCQVADRHLWAKRVQLKTRQPTKMVRFQFASLSNNARPKSPYDTFLVLGDVGYQSGAPIPMTTLSQEIKAVHPAIGYEF